MLSLSIREHNHQSTDVDNISVKYKAMSDRQCHGV
jgi:hypothetical protein